ncbi:MAG: pyruvate kinase, partial [Oscillospiraceae bacterium]
MRKTKIVCTIGPSTDDENVMRELMKSGMDVARFNFSHSTHDVHKKRFETISRLREELGINVATLLDTKGPEIRLRDFKDHKPVILKDGQEFILTTDEIEGTAEKASITFANLPKDVSVGDKILIDDGAIELVTAAIDKNNIICKVIHGGKVSDHKGINVPGVKLSMPYVSDADMADLEFGAKMHFDFIAASFVRTAADVIYLRRLTQSLGWFDTRIIAKIENAEGVANIDEILEAADGIMVARGDMGVEIPFEQIPAIQKELIHKAYNAGKQVITATQMLESMISNPRPTRAEIT